MARVNWLDDNTELPILDEQVQRLEHFTTSLADGVIDKDELAKQQSHLIDSMKAIEADLSDDQHEKVTRMMLELTAYNIMNTLHELAAERLRHGFKG